MWRYWPLLCWPCRSQNLRNKARQSRQHQLLKDRQHARVVSPRAIDRLLVAVEDSATDIQNVALAFKCA